MCLAVPAKVIAVEDSVGKVDISLMLLPETKVGDFVLVHAGFAIQTVTQEEVEETNALLAEMNGAPRTVNDIPEGAAGGQV